MHTIWAIIIDKVLNTPLMGAYNMGYIIDKVLNTPLMGAYNMGYTNNNNIDKLLNIPYGCIQYGLY